MKKRSLSGITLRITRFAAFMLAAVLLISSCSNRIDPKAKITSKSDYSKPGLWAYLGDNGGSESKTADCFLICPTVYIGRGKAGNMSVNDPTVKRTFTGALNAQKGIYSDSCTMYAPFYSQASIEVYSLKDTEAESFFEIAYADVEKAFLYYMHNYNHGRPLILAGFSQGADMCIRLLKDHGNDPGVRKVLTACYAIGWRVTDEEVSSYPHLKTAQGESDTGVIIVYDCEAEDVTTSLIVPEGMKTRSINPLNWKTDSTLAEKTLNKGSIMDDGSEISNLTGCYIDPVRGTLKITDVNKGDYPPGPSCFAEGEYHLYDFRFFFRNLKENVAIRLKAFEGQKGSIV